MKSLVGGNIFGATRNYSIDFIQNKVQKFFCLDIFGIVTLKGLHPQNISQKINADTNTDNPASAFHPLCDGIFIPFHNITLLNISKAQRATLREEKKLVIHCSSSLGSRDPNQLYADFVSIQVNSSYRFMNFSFLLSPRRTSEVDKGKLAIFKLRKLLPRRLKGRTRTATLILQLLSAGFGSILAI